MFMCHCCTPDEFVPPDNSTTLLWGRLEAGYDKRGWKYQTLTAWIVVPICYFCEDNMNINWARGLFGREQHILPGLIYVAGY